MVLLRCTADPQNTVSGLKKRISAVSIYDDTNSVTLFTSGLNNYGNWLPITVNAVIPITVDNGFNHADIKITFPNSSDPDNSMLDGHGNSTFFIKYLGPLII